MRSLGLLEIIPQVKQTMRYVAKLQPTSKKTTPDSISADGTERVGRGEKKAWLNELDVNLASMVN